MRVVAPRRQPAGFTLIELLVVIAIIAILAAILFPVFARAREKARQTSCLSNLKQIGLALMMYDQDYDEALPPAYIDYDQSGGYSDLDLSWRASILPYCKNKAMFICPSARSQNQFESNWTTDVTLNCGYSGTGVHFNAGPPTPVWGMSPGYIAEPTQTIEVFDGFSFIDGPGSNSHGYVRSASDAAAMRHNGGAVYLFADGHSKWYQPRSIKCNATTGECWWDCE
ncbi:MAG: DUF1559 domain-containing protein [Armatimonadetes bacterium]|nr:DUF1559 domain-containing protein [Armatimonadota bacterium]